MGFLGFPQTAKRVRERIMPHGVAILLLCNVHCAEEGQYVVVVADMSWMLYNADSSTSRWYTECMNSSVFLSLSVYLFLCKLCLSLCSVCSSVYMVNSFVSESSKGKGNCIAVMEHHVTVTECHLPYGITQCYLLPDTSERTPPSPQPVRPVLDLPNPGGIEGDSDSALGRHCAL